MKQTHQSNTEFCDPVAAKVDLHLLISQLGTPDTLQQMTLLLEASSKLVETVAYGAAGKTSGSEVIKLLALASELDMQSKKLGGAVAS